MGFYLDIDQLEPITYAVNRFVLSISERYFIFILKKHKHPCIVFAFHPINETEYTRK